MFGEGQGYALETLSLEDVLIASDILLPYFRSEPSISIESTLTALDVFVSRSKRRYINNLNDGLAPLDSMLMFMNERYILDFGDGAVDEILRVDDSVYMKPTFRHYSTLESNFVIEETFTIEEVSSHPLNMDNSFGVSEDFQVHSVQRFLFFTDVAYFADKMETPMYLTVIGGTGSGAYPHGTYADIQASLDSDEHFMAWIGHTQGVTNVVAKNTTILLTTTMYRLRGTTVEALKGELSSREILALGGRMSAANLDIVMEQGTTFERNLYYKDNNGKPIDITGYTAAMHVRAQKKASEALLTLTSSAGYITIGGAIGHLEIHIPANEMDDLNFIWGFYDLELYPEGDTTQAFRLLEGRIRLTKEVTRL